MIWGALLIYLLSPLIELGIIIALAVQVSQYKKANRELKLRLDDRQVAAPQEPDQQEILRQSVAPQESAQPESFTGHSTESAIERSEKNLHIPSAKVPEKHSASMSWRQGIFPLVTGVLFIILAGIIFATTTWNHLSDLAKVLLVLAASGLFFGSSRLAVNKLQIEKTGKAFYILGSIFLFVTVLSAGYFEILGPGFSIGGENRLLVLFLGILLADGALCAGMKRFGDGTYASICFTGVTLAVACLIGGMHLSRTGFTAGMAVYGIAIVLLDKRISSVVLRLAPQISSKIVSSFATVNLWGISLLVLGHTDFGLMPGLVTLAMAGIHLYVGQQTKSYYGNLYAAPVFLFISILRIASPAHVDGWFYTGAATLVFMAVIEYSGMISESGRKCLGWAGLVNAVLLFLAVNVSSLCKITISLSGVICMGILLLDMTLLALKKESVIYKAIWAALLEIFLHYIIGYLHMNKYAELLGIILVSGGLLWYGTKKTYRLKSMQGALICTAAIALDTVFLLLWTKMSVWIVPDDVAGILLNSMQAESALSASIAVLVLTAAVSGWSRKFHTVRSFLPFILVSLTMTVRLFLKSAWGITVSAEGVMSAILVLMILWDILRKDRLAIGILILGTLYEWYIPFYLVLAGYLFIKSAQKSVEKKRLCRYGGCIYLLGGCFQEIYGKVESITACMLVVAVVCLVEYVVFRYSRLEEEKTPFFEIIGSVICLLLGISFYMEQTLAVWYLLPVLVCFGLVYVLCWKKRFHVLNLMTSLICLGIPAILDFRYHMSSSQLYGAVLAAVLLTGLLARMKRPVLEGSKDKIAVADWYHILVIVALVPMTVHAEPLWRFLYLLLLTAYAIQFVTVPYLKGISVTAAGFMLCLAFWNQPFVVWPELLSLEIRLIPIVALASVLPLIWGKRKMVDTVQTVLYTGCLVILAADALRTQNLADALLLEGICLAIFLYAWKKKSRRYLCLSVGFMCGVAVYLTRSFWLSLAWWVYLLAAGIGLLIFAAVNEWRKSKK